MARGPQGFWRPDRSAWYATVAGKMCRLNYPDGSPVGKDDQQGRLEALARLVGERGGSVDPGGLISCDGLMRAYMAWQVASEAKPKTIQGHKLALEAFGSHAPRGRKPVGLRPAVSVGPAEWSSFRAALESRGLAPRTVERHLASIRACWRWGARVVAGRRPPRLIPRDPFRADDFLETFKAERRVVRGVLSGEQVRAILAAAESEAEPFRLALRVQAESGCRTGEVLSLRWEWWDGAAFVVPPKEHKTGHRTGRARVIGVTAATARLIEDWRPHAHPVWPFKSLDGRKQHVPPGMSWYGDCFARTVARVTIPLPAGVSPYFFRTTWVRDARRAGVDSRESAASAGHSVAVAAELYDVHDSEDARRVVERVARSRGEG